jgi:predicted RNA-binding Zn-ribbon protein involved in translation (DUF1610 family)
MITRKEFYKFHSHCPTCGNDKVGSTLKGIIQHSDKDYIDDNDVWCDQCGFKGKYFDLVSKRTVVLNNLLSE